ncbi:hypothetical protein MPER_06961 [Moniliophthora perniciosa FA553]|nr:hypothetical protein MPER_06961 [Moniliophthora perniciosa FA553]
METIHDWNIVHNQLMDDYIPRHILWRAHDQRPFIIDFVTASLHPCTRTIPLVPMQMVDWSPRKSHLCLELHIVGGFLGYLGQKNGYSQELLDRASQWYSESMLRISEAQEDGLVPMDDELEIMRRQKELLVQWAQDSESAKLPMDAARTPAPSAITSTTASTAHPRI